ncbi:ATP-binding protein [Litorilinea aerophila]|uniref:ATP-binding protein n=1 Tax=Litorilinea aerophila TaxID=1204385 RepID=A0A540VHC7_9CHLR|nr:ATP-binding protein [Litorilinea aerophila]MCC9076844.1 ATP-binding protein [Litorilinea aerophila]
MTIAPTEQAQRQSSAGPLPDQPPSQGTPLLRHFALAALADRLYETLADRPDLPEHQFLLDQLAVVQAAPGGHGDWVERLATALRRPASADLHLLHLAQTLQLTVFELLTVALTAAVEDEAMVGRTLAHLQTPLGGSRPTLGLLATAFSSLLDATTHPIHLLMTGAAVQSGLLEVLNASAPWTERSLRVPPHLCLAIHGHDGLYPGATIGVALEGLPPLPPSLRREAAQHARGLAAGRQLLVIRTNALAEGKAAAAWIGEELGRRPVFLSEERPVGLSPWLILRELLPVFLLELAPGQRYTLPPLPFYPGPVLALCGPDGTVDGETMPTLRWSLSVPPPAERRQLWQMALDNPDEALVDELARHYRHGSARIAELGHLARLQAIRRGAEQPERCDVLHAARSGEGGGLDALAQLLPDSIPDEALVTPPTLQQELERLLLRCRARDGLVEGLGLSAVARYRPGVCALFVGPSGTGKTLAAGWLATRLGLPLYRVDLAAVTSKYIGETEKNLAQLLARAEQAEVILLFDEADSLFGKRTDVQQANDRFANAQTNYLLQRMEAYDGIAILTSNSRTRFDPAFTRRLDAIIEFAVPGPQERRALWLAHLGEHHRLPPQDLNRLAAAADLTGGHIRNVVLAAAVLAQQTSRPIEYRDILEGLKAEYRKLNKQMPVVLKP